jgi:hypothetical protein
MLLWAGRPGDAEAAVSKMVIPAQTAVRTHDGVCVAMTSDAHLDLASKLAAGERYFIRVHSHPTRAYHSETDDANLVLSHDGALSIVVPRFARDVADDFAKCAVYEYTAGDGWTRLSEEDVAQRFVISGGAQQ